MLALSFLHIKLRLGCSNLDVGPMTCVGKDSDHVTCFSSFTGDGVTRAHTSPLVKNAYPQGKGRGGRSHRVQNALSHFTKHTLQEEGVFPCLRGSPKAGREAHVLPYDPLTGDARSVSEPHHSRGRA